MGKLKQHLAWGQNRKQTHSEHNKIVECPSILVVGASEVLLIILTLLSFNGLGPLICSNSELVL
jgi:hypothetical protein